MVGQYDFRQSDIEQIKNEIAKKLKIKDGKIVFDGKKIIITMKGKPGVTPQKGLDYYDGKSGKPPAHQWEGTKIRFQNPDGTWGQWVDLKGKPGDKGKTPKKGVDYFDGEDGETPVKGVDYKDGEPGKDAIIPDSVTIAVLTDVELIDGKLSKKYQHVKVYIED